MRGLLFCFVALAMLAAVQGEEKEQPEQMMDAATFEDEEYKQCFRCDLGFWDACYTTKTNCSHTEKCYTGRGKAANLLDVKTLGCARAEECDVVTTVQLFTNKSVFIMTKHCCDTHLCNSARTHSAEPLLRLFFILVTAWKFSGFSLESH